MGEKSAAPFSPEHRTLDDTRPVMTSRATPLTAELAVLVNTARRMLVQLRYWATHIRPLQALAAFEPEIARRPPRP